MVAHDTWRSELECHSVPRVDICANTVNNLFFRWFIVTVIVFAGIVTGIETYPPLATRFHTMLRVIDVIILAIFVIEIVLKIAACGRQPRRFFHDSWNMFDFVIVVVCLLPLDAQFIYVVRLVRILRVLRLITALPRLQVIVGALLRSVPSIGYVSALLFILFYIYAVMGVHFFGGNDPVNFANLHVSLLSLLKVVTLQNWVDIMYTSMYGCNNYGYSDTPQLCVAPSAHPFLSPAVLRVIRTARHDDHAQPLHRGHHQQHDRPAQASRSEHEAASSARPQHSTGISQPDNQARKNQRTSVVA